MESYYISMFLISILKKKQFREFVYSKSGLACRDATEHTPALKNVFNKLCPREKASKLTVASLKLFAFPHQQESLPPHVIKLLLGEGTEVQGTRKVIYP